MNHDMLPDEKSGTMNRKNHKALLADDPINQLSTTDSKTRAPLAANKCNIREKMCLKKLF